jgi:hypothetical protein
MPEKKAPAKPVINTAGRPSADVEIHAMRVCFKAFDALEKDARERVMLHIVTRYELDVFQGDGEV